MKQRFQKWCKFTWLCAMGLMAPAVFGQNLHGSRDVHLVWMGGNDCPPCVAWRAFELPKLEKTEVFSKVRFSYVAKTIRSPVPPRFFLPDAVKPLKDKLDTASAGRSGSPHAAIVVDGEVYHYFFGSANGAAELMEKMLNAALSGTEFPVQRCLKLDAGNARKCAERP